MVLTYEALNTVGKVYWYIGYGVLMGKVLVIVFENGCEVTGLAIFTCWNWGWYWMGEGRSVWEIGLGGRFIGYRWLKFDWERIDWSNGDVVVG